jgi:membrane associated rhomboid family serine protease
MLSNIPQDREGRSFYSRVFFLLLFFSGILWNAIEFFVWRMPSGITESGGYGASGVVYGAIGICTASALMNFAVPLGKHFRSLNTPHREITMQDLFSATTNLLILISILFLILSDPALFLAAGPETNIFAHFGGFAIGFLSAAFLFCKHSIRRAGNSGFSGR